MGKYDVLRDLLRGRSGPSTELSFEDIDAVVGGLPRSAHNHRAWWGNEADGRHVQARAWLDAGWRVEEVDLAGGRVRFRSAGSE